MAFFPRFNSNGRRSFQQKDNSRTRVRPEFGVIKDLPEIERSVHAGPAVLTQPFDLVLHL
jgi:hypothetical protein